MNEQQRFLLASNKAKISEDLIVRIFSVDSNCVKCFLASKFQTGASTYRKSILDQAKPILITLFVLGNK